MTGTGLFVLLDHFDIGPMRAELATSGHLRILGPPETVEAMRSALTEHAALVHATLIGRGTGHLPAPCDQCGAVTMTAAKSPRSSKRKTWPRCRMTPDCPGRHIPRPGDLDRLKDAPPPPAGERPPPAPDKRWLSKPPEPWPTPPARPKRRTA